MDDFTPPTTASRLLPDAELAQETNNELPRAVLRPGHHFLLDGTWRFAIDLDDVGLTEDWEQGYDYRLEAHSGPARLRPTWPPPTPMARTASGKTKVVAWYEREFTLPEVAENNNRTLFQLTFGACGYETRVWLNGQPAAHHRGRGRALRRVHLVLATSCPRTTCAPVNRLTVRIADTMDAEIAARQAGVARVQARRHLVPDPHRGRAQRVARNRGAQPPALARGRRERGRGPAGALQPHDCASTTRAPTRCACRCSRPTARPPSAARQRSDFPLRLDAGQQRAARGAGAARRPRCGRPEAPHLLPPRGPAHRRQTGYAAQIETPLRAAQNRGARPLRVPQQRSRCTSTASSTSPARPPTRRCGATCTP
ncbi:MAG: hypothetical protein WKG07_17090 [Hymenobacter sp.]